MRKKGIRLSGDKVFDLINRLLLTLITCIIVFPLWNVVVNSFSSATAVASGKSVFWPAEFSTANYKAVFSDTSIWSAFLISVLKTLIGVGGACIFLFNGSVWHEQGISARKKTLHSNGRHHNVFLRWYDSNVFAN